MNQKVFLIICGVLFISSCSVLFLFVIFTPEQDFVIDPYTTKVSCNDGSCTFHATIMQVVDKNETIFYKLKREVVVDSVFFVGMKQPAFVVGDCIAVSGSVQTYKGKESIVAQTLRGCD